MFIHITKGSRVPLTRQIAEQIRALCAAGTLAPGVQLPSVRQLGRELGVNQNTILRVYDRLAAEGVLESRHGEGTFVSRGATKRRLDRQVIQWHEELHRVVRQAHLLGLTPEEFQQASAEAWVALGELVESEHKT